MSAECRVGVRLGPSTGREFAPELPPNSPERRENPALATGLPTTFSLQIGGDGGIRTPGTSKRHNGFRDRRILSQAFHADLNKAHASRAFPRVFD